MFSIKTLVLAATIAATAAFGTRQASAHGNSVSFGFGYSSAPAYGYSAPAYGYYAPAPVYVAPAPVYAAPVVVAPQSVYVTQQPVYAAPAVAYPQTYYYYPAPAVVYRQPAAVFDPFVRLNLHFHF